jgi:acyl-CoA synthetase (AMP-forming)/AMP-acid ligase II
MIYVHSLGRAARYYPKRTALSVGGKQLTFGDLDLRVGRIAAELIRHGFSPGDRLALLLPNESEYIELVYACSRLGVVVVPLNTRYSSIEVDRVIEDAAPRGLVRHSSFAAPTVAVPWQRVLDKEPFEESNDSPGEVFYDPDALLAMIYTSGTTGRPKGAMLTHANVLANVHNLNYWMRYREGGSYLHAAPMFHIADLPAMFAAPAFGASQVSLPRFNPLKFCEEVEKQRITHTVLVPTMINLLTQLPDFSRFDLSSLEVLAYGGSPIAPELIRRTRELLPRVELVQVYGLTETGFLTGLQASEHSPERLTSCGRPCPGIDVRVADEAGNPLPVGERGELIARGANVMRGYWNNQAETSAVFRNGFFRTGDIGYQDAAGFIYVVDRAKDMIITGGENVYSGEVEAAIYEQPAVREAAVIGLPDPQWGELVTACVVLKPGTSLTAEELMLHCRRRLANYKVPRRVEFLESELPKNGSGKIVKRALRERFSVYGARPAC